MLFLDTKKVNFYRVKCWVVTWCNWDLFRLFLRVCLQVG